MLPLLESTDDASGGHWVDDPLLSKDFAAFVDLPLLSTDEVFLGTEDRSSAASSERTVWSHCRDGSLDIYAACAILSLHLLSFETALVVAISVASTTVYFFLAVDFGANLSWTIVSFAIVAPMIMQIRQAFSRREVALDLLADVKALMCNVLLAHALWDWGKNERMKLPPIHVLKTKRLLRGIVADIHRILTLPTFTRGRHQFTGYGRGEAREYLQLFHSLSRRVTFTVQQLHLQVEVMKAVGLPANEASRINQYHWLLQARIEKLSNIKLYRTPQATRSFTRLFIMILPFFYGPYYVYIAKGGAGLRTNFAFALLLSVVTSLVMIGIFNVEKALEDPFTDEGLDGVKVPRAIARILDALDVIHPSDATGNLETKSLASTFRDDNV
ncbi:hypothetical protein ACHHYP_08705 [Achlya hypogyna]|uniref:Transmembrane protein n=1 Tax=Achlya hypogyna TaxID=1202772 RepID=A0A1V9YP24_ACHHY|nr:hypothetical protein ACHHYP_08705 [Achlya hypogyna]